MTDDDFCRTCKRPLGDDPVTLSYSKDSELGFCSKRHRRDYLDGLPPGSLIKQNHADDIDPEPWGLEDA